MALARLVTFVPFTLIKSADVNGEINNILNNAIALLSPTTGPINFNFQAHTNLLPSAITASSGAQGQALIATSSGGAIFGSVASGSRVKGLIGTISSQSGGFSADQYVMQTTNAAQSWVVTATSSYSASVGVAGPAAGGRDIAGAFASTYVHWYAITTGPNSTAPAGLVSTNPPNVGPVALPTGYTGLTYLGGSVYTSASTTVAQNHRFNGSMANYETRQQVVTNGTATSETTVSLGLTVPPNAERTFLGWQYLTGNPNVHTFRIRVVSGSDFDGSTLTASAVASVFNSKSELPNVGNAFIYLFSSAPVGADGLQAYVHGYKMPNGDA